MTDQLQKLAAGNTQFALELYSRLCDTPGNVCFSPYSLLIALAMTYVGARSETEKQMADVLHFPAVQDEVHQSFAGLQALINGLDDQETIQLRMANALFPHDAYPFLVDFLACLKESYQTSLTPLNFLDTERARQQINTWVAEKTRGQISEIIPTGGLASLTRLVLVNAIYFKGLWQNPFDTRFTWEAPFWVSPDQSVTVPMMMKKAAFGLANVKNAQILEMDHCEGKTSLVFILPSEAGGLPALEKGLTAAILEDWLSQLFETEVNVCLPRFRVKSGFALKDILISLGMPDAFDAAKADFSGMDGKHFPEGLLINQIFHQATTDVNEEGATATAATAAVMQLRGIHAVPEFYANHPFLFLIREKTTGCLLFMGRVSDPRGSM